MGGSECGVPDARKESRDKMPASGAGEGKDERTSDTAKKE